MIALSESKRRSFGPSEKVCDLGTVILVHGLSASLLFMAPLARRLRAEGYQTVNWGYRSGRYSCEHHAQNLAATISDLNANNGDAPLHFVGHSMGSIVIRAALTWTRPPRMGRVVMLAPPNCGSHVARRIGPLFRWICPTMEELSDTAASYVNRLSRPEGYEFGVIAAKYDWVIAEECTWLPGMADHVVVPCNHGLLPWHPRAIALTSQFLRLGTFDL